MHCTYSAQRYFNFIDSYINTKTYFDSCRVAMGKYQQFSSQMLIREHFIG